MSNSYSIFNPQSSASVRRNSCALAVMIKVPRAGASKTRLVPPLAPDEAAALSVCFLHDTTANIADVAFDESADSIAVYTPVGAESAFNELLPSGFCLLAQRGESLGDRLFHAAEDLLNLGYESLCLINSDSPTLPRASLIKAVGALSHPGDRVVLGPSKDGGYYLIGLKKAHRHLFNNIEWSSAQVLSQTIERAGEIALDVELLPAWYDVDDAASLRHLCDELFAQNGARTTHDDFIGYPAPHTRDYLRRLMETKGANISGRTRK